jgi:hypothetical protein
MNITLTRHKKTGQSVFGILDVGGKRIATLESAQYLFNDGRYRLVYEYSPKFKRRLWEFYGIPNRSEIKFHIGSHHTHSKGCVLIGDNDMDSLHSSLDSSKNYGIIVQTLFKKKKKSMKKLVEKLLEALIALLVKKLEVFINSDLNEDGKIG